MPELDKLAQELEQTMADRKMMMAYGRSASGELFVLSFLAAQAEPALPSELSQALQSSTARISAVLKSLEAKGQVIRQTDPHNRRRVWVTITQEGRQRVERMHGRMGQHLRRVLTQMGEADAAEYVRLTKRFMAFARQSPPRDLLTGQAPGEAQSKEEASTC